MPKRTAKQRRQTLARQVEKHLPAKGGKSGETVIPDRLLRRIINENSK